MNVKIYFKRIKPELYKYQEDSGNAHETFTSHKSQFHYRKSKLLRSELEN